MSEHLPDAWDAWNSESEAKRSIADWLAPMHGYLSRGCVEGIAGRIVANRAYVLSVLSSLGSNDRGEVLKQQRSAEQTDREYLMEQASYHKQCWREFSALAEAAGAHHRDLYDPDEVAVDREDDRLREQRQDERAAEGAPRVAS